MLVCPPWVKFRTYTNKRGVRGHTKQTDNISKPDLFNQSITRTTERVTYAQKLKYSIVYSAPPQYQKAQTQPLETKSTTTDTNAANYDGFKYCH